MLLPLCMLRSWVQVVMKIEKCGLSNLALCISTLATSYRLLVSASQAQRPIYKALITTPIFPKKCYTTLPGAHYFLFLSICFSDSMVSWGLRRQREYCGWLWGSLRLPAELNKCTVSFSCNDLLLNIAMIFSDNAFLFGTVSHDIWSMPYKCGRSCFV